MRSTVLGGSLLAGTLLALCTPALAQTIGLSLPLSGRYAPLGNQIDIGFQRAIEDHVAQGAPRPQVVLVDDACSAEGAQKVLPRLRAADIVVGAPCFDAAFALADGLGRTPVIALGLRHPQTERRIDGGAPLYVVGPDGTAEARAVADLVLERWRETPFALLDDGSVYGRALSDALRALAEERGLKPIEVASFRPLQSNQRALVRRLARSGVEALFVAGDAEDAATFARDAAAIAPGTRVATGETGLLVPFVDEPPPAGLLIVGQPERRDHPSAEGLASRLAERGMPPDDGILEGYALGQIALAFTGERRAKGGELRTVIGSIRFEDNRAVAQPLVLLRWNGERLVPARD